jgi:hypothetical protein
LDAVTGAVVIAGLKYVGQPSLEVVTEVVGRILTPTADAMGKDIAEAYTAWRQRRAERATTLLVRSAGVIVESGEEPQTVPGRLLFPILERGSVEEDDSLFEKWTALLANASTRPSGVLPAFASILAELSPTEARLLERARSVIARIADINQSVSGLPTAETNAQSTELWSQLTMPQLGAFVGVSESDVGLMCDNLERLKLLGASADPTSDYMPVVFVRMARLSAFGAAFIDACSIDGWVVVKQVRRPVIG